jgi:hypothetical protein
MPLIFGLICLALALSLTVFWWSPAFLAAFQVLLVLFLFFAGLILSLVGYSAMKASREFTEAVTSDSDSANPNSTS